MKTRYTICFVLLFCFIYNLCYAQKTIKIDPSNYASKSVLFDIVICEGEATSFGVEIEGGNAGITFSWTLDNGITVVNLNHNSDMYNIQNADVSDSGIYEITMTPVAGDPFSSIFNLTVIPKIDLNPVEDVIAYDFDGDGLYSFNFNGDVTPLILAGLNTSLYRVEYYLTEIDHTGNSQTNKLNNPYTTTTPYVTETIYAKIYYKNIDKCFNTTQFQITVREVIPNQPSDYALCDDTASGSDTDGFHNSFFLETKDADVLGTLPEDEYNISYHTTLLGAQTSSVTDVIDKSSPYGNTQINEQTIFVRLEHLTNDFVIVSSNQLENFKPFKLVVIPLPIIEPVTELIQCDVDADLSSLINLTLAEKNITDEQNVTFRYYPTHADATANTLEILSPTSHEVHNGDTIWVKVISDESCERISQLNIRLHVDNNAITFNETIEACNLIVTNNLNEDIYNGIAYFNFTDIITNIKDLFPISLQSELDVLIFENSENRDTVTSKIEDVTNYLNTDLPASTPENLYFKVINTTNNECKGIGNFSILVNQNPVFHVNSPQSICLNTNDTLIIKAEDPVDNYSYQWTKNNENSILSIEQDLEVSTEGEYHVKATNTTTFCERIKTITVLKSEIATITANDIQILESAYNNAITINDNNLGIGNYEYALFNEDQTDIERDYQDNTYFGDLAGGIYTIVVRDKNNCGEVPYQVSVLEFPKFITPNNDGNNDTFAIKGIDPAIYSNGRIYIFDRFGKKLSEISIQEEGWDGTFNGKLLPPNDYWYHIELIDNTGNIRNQKGHFSLIRN